MKIPEQVATFLYEILLRIDTRVLSCTVMILHENAQIFVVIITSGSGDLRPKA